MSKKNIHDSDYSYFDSKSNTSAHTDYSWYFNGDHFSDPRTGTLKPNSNPFEDKLILLTSETATHSSTIVYDSDYSYFDGKSSSAAHTDYSYYFDGDRFFDPRTGTLKFNSTLFEDKVTPLISKAATCFLRLVTAKYCPPPAAAELKIATETYLKSPEEFNTYVGSHFHPDNIPSIISAAENNAANFDQLIQRAQIESDTTGAIKDIVDAF